MAKRKKNKHNTTQKTEAHYKPMVNSGTPDWKVVPAPLIPLVTNLVIYKSGMMTGRGCHYDKRNIHVYVV